MSSPLQWTLSEDASTAILSGTIDEYSDLEKLGRSMSKPTVHLDVGGIQRINSLGVRHWIQLMRSFAQKQVVLQRCPPVMVEQLCALRDFRGHARVESVLLPYSCERCGTRASVEFALTGAPALPEGPDCSGCGLPSTFDDYPERYLGLSAQPKPIASP